MRVLLVDDHRLMSDGVTNLLTAHGIEVLGVASDGLEAIAMVQELCPDVILMDIRMPRCDGLSATRQIKALWPEIQILMLTTSAEDQDLFESVKSGASGYLLKSISGDAFIEALRGLEQGTPPFSPGLASRLLSEFAKLSVTEESSSRPARRPNEKESQPNGLTERQTEVLRLVAEGLTYRDVGQRLSLSERTVRFHMTEIMSRLHLQNRNQVLAYAGKLGLTNGDQNHHTNMSEVTVYAPR
jgi:DNA-binding NarL/FixJ family response regulator